MKRVRKEGAPRGAPASASAPPRSPRGGPPRARPSPRTLPAQNHTDFLNLRRVSNRVETGRLPRRIPHANAMRPRAAAHKERGCVLNSAACSDGPAQGRRTRARPRAPPPAASAPPRSRPRCSAPPARPRARPRAGPKHTAVPPQGTQATALRSPYAIAERHGSHGRSRRLWKREACLLLQRPDFVSVGHDEHLARRTALSATRRRAGGGSVGQEGLPSPLARPSPPRACGPPPWPLPIPQ